MGLFSFWSKFQNSQIRKLTEDGDARAQNEVGACYAAGDGVSCQDYGEAVKWFYKAAMQGNADAQCNLGKCYLSGLGVKQDCSEAAKWYRKSAEQGNSCAQNALKHMAMY